MCSTLSITYISLSGLFIHLGHNFFYEVVLFFQAFAQFETGKTTDGDVLTDCADFSLSSVLIVLSGS